MLRISKIDSDNGCRFVVEGKLITPWTAELKNACEAARIGLDGRELVIDVRNLIAISQEGENLLLDLMNQGAKFRCSGVFTKHVFRQLARRLRTEVQEGK
jgi:hypothetical protein